MYNNETKIHIFLLLTVSIMFASCQRQDGGNAPGGTLPTSEGALDMSEISYTESVTSGPYEISGSTEELVEKKVSGSITIEGVFNE